MFKKDYSKKKSKTCHNLRFYYPVYNSTNNMHNMMNMKPSKKNSVNQKGRQLQILEQYMMNEGVQLIPANNAINNSLHLFITVVKKQNGNDLMPFLGQYANLLRISGVDYIKFQYNLSLYEFWKKQPEIINNLVDVYSFIRVKSYHTELLDAILCVLLKNPRSAFMNLWLLKIIFKKLACNDRSFLTCLDAIKVWDICLKVSELHKSQNYKVILKNAITFVKQNMFSTQQEKITFLLENLLSTSNNHQKLFFECGAKEFSRRCSIISKIPQRIYEKSTLFEIVKFFTIYQLYPPFFEQRLAYLSTLDESRLSGKIMNDIFLDYNFPRWTLNYEVYYSSFKYQSLLTWLLMGNNLRYFTPMPIQITKKAAHFISTIDESGDLQPSEIEKFTLNRIIYFGQLRANGVAKDYALTVSSKLCEIEYLRDKSLWLYIFTKLYTIGIQLSELRETIDFISHKEDLTFLKSISLNNLRQAVFEWHEEIQRYKYVDKCKHVKLPIKGIEKFVHTLKDEVYEIKQIETALELYSEGQRMRHCVFTYLRRCVEMGCYIFSLTKISANNEIDPVVTIELNKNNSIVQVKGKHNRSCSKVEKAIIQLWAEERNLKMAM
jgi:hypothetical protein